MMTNDAHESPGAAGGAPLQRGVGPARNVDALRLSTADKGPGLRLFIKRGATTWYSVGFKTRKAASEWIDSHGRDLDWRCGYLFRLRGDARDVQIVSRLGEPVRA
jgi:hypothetical protein